MNNATDAQGSTRDSRCDVQTTDASDAKLRAQTEIILSMPIADRLRQLEAEANFFSSVLPLDG